MTAPADIIGRQPAVLHITPSKPALWYGTIIEGRPLTAEQYQTMISAGLDVLRCETITVKRNASDGEMYWGIGQVPPQYHFECPVLGRRKDGKISVIAPSGEKALVRSDGWVGAPGKPKRGF